MSNATVKLGVFTLAMSLGFLLSTHSIERPATGVTALLTMAVGIGGDAVAATATETETGFAVPGTVHRGNGRALHAPSAAGMPAAVGSFLAGQGHGPTTVNSLRLEREMPVGTAGISVLDYTQEIGGLTVHGAGVKAIFDGGGALVTLQENLAPVGPISRAAIGPRAALDEVIAILHPDMSAGLVESGRFGNSVSFAGENYFFRDPSVTRVAIPMADGGLQEGYLVETWSDDDNQLHHSLVNGDGWVVHMQNRTVNDSYNVFPVNPNVTAQGIENGVLSGDSNSPDGWLDGGLQSTLDISGNNVRAYLDLDGNDVPDGGGAMVSNGDFLTSADRLADPATTPNREVAIQNLFYLNNVIHDELYASGFTESWRNFQHLNFGDGGSGGIDGDPVLAEAQDGAGTNNANFATPPDGLPGRMQMFLWDGVIKDLFGNPVGYLNYAYAANLVIGEFDAGNDVTEHYLAADALFGPALTATGVSADIVYIGGDGCTGMNGVTVAGKVALVDRGGCYFTSKALNAQAAGALVLIVANSPANGDELTQMDGPPGEGGLVNIPVILVGNTDGANLKSQAGIGATLRSNPASARDGDVDADIVRHEYGHGLSWRLVGNMDGIMGGSLGEGVSDAYAAIMTDDDRIAEYSIALPGGLRSAPYANYLADTGRVYESFQGQVHADGEIYAAMIWDMWERYRDDTSTNGVAGTPEARQSLIVGDMVEGMKVTLHQCLQPTFQTMRDGLLLAIGGTADPNGAPANQERWCHAWRAFAKYGLGANATTNCAHDPDPRFSFIINTTWNWVNGFDVPTQCNNVDGLPAATITAPADTTSWPEGAPLAFTGTASDAEDGDLAASLFWMSSLDGEFGRGASVATTGLSGGTHTITASVTDADGNSSSDVITVTITSSSTANEPPTAAFTFTTSGLTANFTDTSTDEDGTIVSWAWDFDTGVTSGADTSTLQNPSHSYAATGLYNVELIVTDNNGAERITTRTVRVEAPTGSNTPPNVTNPGGQTSTEGDTVSLQIDAIDSVNDTLTYVATGLPADLLINFDTGLISGPVPIGAAGSYSASVTVSDGTDGTTVNFGWTVNATGPNQPPVADAGGNNGNYAVQIPKGRNATASITLIGSGSDPDGDDNDLTFFWTQTGTSAAWTTAVADVNGLTQGKHEFDLTVTDGLGASDTATACVEVHKSKNPEGLCTTTSGPTPPVASFTYSCTDVACSFADASSSTDGDAITGWSWDFGSEGTSTAQNPSYTFSAAGTYPVKLTVTDKDGNDFDIQDVSVSVGGGGPTMMTVSSITFSVKGKGLTGTVTIDPKLSDAIVNASFCRPGLFGGEICPFDKYDEPTSGKGKASFKIIGYTAGVQYTLTVHSVTLSGYTLDVQNSILVNYVTP